MNTGAEAVETALKLARKWAYTKKGVPEGRAVIRCVVCPYVDPPTACASRRSSSRRKISCAQCQGHVGAMLVLGGVDATGPHLFTIHPHGSTDKLPHVITMGSGSLAAMTVFESSWRPNMNRADALQLVKDAISAGIFNDLGSGYNVNACIITATHTEMLRNVEMPNERATEERRCNFRRGTTAWKM
ncbi:nucleophile aminohydrolase [Mycena pura]|uniref:Nucleophile aminohydrolase n=1 Tax=Mycena pura TaxID=153505 RepID=A0AAD6YKX0_9AGAR|nr:nucleophile aminohydrolase [Mycena pura]